MLLRWFKQLHWPLIFAMAGLIGIGTVFIHSASHYDTTSYITRQLFWTGVGLAVLLMVPMFGYRTFLSLGPVFYFVVLVMLLWVDIAGAHRLGAQRWIALGPFALQPSEFAKLATVIALANFLGERSPREGQLGTIIIALIIVFIPLAMIVKQPDLGSSLLFMPMIGVLFFLWGIRKRYFIYATAIGGVAAPLLWKFLKPYQKKRILVFLDPNQDPLGAGYTAIQAKIAVGSGGLFGKGYMAGTQSQLQFVPEHHTDFIFCVLGEEWGFFGSLILLVCYAFLFRAMFQIMEATTDIKARLLIAGIAAVTISQLFINIGMTFGIMPITGITLPFVSYGGSSLVASTFAMGLILSVHKERSIF
ncbi:MAG: rod shape-determining protein RodA [Candidatus Omnitrophica bacterium]|nr:rod shape-determining protein RodA [Candidatus Omnitrophota bacterium]